MTARRRFAEATTQVADGVAKAVGDAPPDRLSWVMRTPARRLVLDMIFWQMPRQLDRRRAAGVAATARWRITGRPDGGADVYEVTVADGRCRVRRRETDAEPKVTITVDGAEFLRLVTGNTDPTQAYFTGKLRLGGDLMFAARLMSLFRVPRARGDRARQR